MGALRGDASSLTTAFLTPPDHAGLPPGPLAPLEPSNLVSLGG